MRCSSYCTADAYQIDELAKFLRNEGFEIRFYDQVIHARRDESTGDIFYFTYGCVVSWGFDEKENQEVLKKLKSFESNPLESFIQDDCIYHFGEETIINEEEDEVVLESEDVLIKVGISYALSQSVKLTAFEESINKTIESTRHMPAELANKGKISLSRKKISQKIGALFAERNSINLHSDILDTPEFFWRRPRYEPYYVMGVQYLDLTTRIGILNKRLDVIHELYEILSNELKHSHSSRLELVIIFLIFIEVMMGILRDFLKWI